MRTPQRFERTQKIHSYKQFIPINGHTKCDPDCTCTDADRVISK